MEEKPPIFEYIFSRVLICKTTSDNLEREFVPRLVMPRIGTWFSLRYLTVERRDGVSPE